MDEKQFEKLMLAASKTQLRWLLSCLDDRESLEKFKSLIKKKLQ